jgi:hypothetical protein
MSCFGFRILFSNRVTRRRYPIHILLVYLLVFFGIVAFLSRAIDRLAFLHVHAGRGFLITMLWAIASSILIHNTVSFGFSQLLLFHCCFVDEFFLSSPLPNLVRLALLLFHYCFVDEIFFLFHFRILWRALRLLRDYRDQFFSFSFSCWRALRLVSTRFDSRKNATPMPLSQRPTNCSRRTENLNPSRYYM